MAALPIPESMPGAQWLVLLDAAEVRVVLKDTAPRALAAGTTAGVVASEKISSAALSASIA